MSVDLLENKGIDYIVHGDDPCIVDGKDVYQAAKDLGRYKTIPRTEGVSTTDLVGRLLRLDDTARAFLGTARIQRDFSEGLRAPSSDRKSSLCGRRLGPLPPRPFKIPRGLSSMWRLFTGGRPWG